MHVTGSRYCACFGSLGSLLLGCYPLCPPRLTSLSSRTALDAILFVHQRISFKPIAYSTIDATPANGDSDKGSSRYNMHSSCSSILTQTPHEGGVCYAEMAKISILLYYRVKQLFKYSIISFVIFFLL